MPKVKEFRRKGCENYIQLGSLFNKTTDTSVMAFASTQDPTNTDEERELDEMFITIGVHVDVDVEVDPNIREDPEPVQGDVRETCPDKRVKSVTSSKSKKSARKGERVSEMTEAINNFAYITKKMNEAREARHAAKYAANTTTSSAHPPMKPTPLVDDHGLQKAIELLDTYQDLPPEKFCKIQLALYKCPHKVAFLTLSEERMAIWMEFMGNM